MSILQLGRGSIVIIYQSEFLSYSYIIKRAAINDRWGKLFQSLIENGNEKAKFARIYIECWLCVLQMVLLESLDERWM